MSSFRSPGPVCQLRDWFETDEGTLALTSTARPGVIFSSPDKPAAQQKVVTSPDDQKEFDLLKTLTLWNAEAKKYGKVQIYDQHGHSFKDAAAYVGFRNKYFTSAELYDSFAIDSDAELEKTEWERKNKDPLRLRDVLDHGHQPAVQDLYYRWVRKAYFVKLKKVVDVPSIIHAEMTPELVEAMKQVRLSYHKKFHSGGFNPRPQKHGGGYYLGTLSDHGLGKAVDIEDATNFQFKKEQWAFIEKFTGMTVNRSASRWKGQPELLWKDMKAISDLYVKKLEEGIKKVEAERAAAAKAASATAKPAAAATKPPPAPIDVVLKDVTGQDLAALKRARNGFLTLEWELVEQLSDKGFTWGVTFSDVDIHHFQLDG